MTVPTREKAWRDFSDWCKARRLRALPAHPWTVAAYARWCEARHRYPMIVKRIKAIARVHVLKCLSAPDRHPTVARTLRTIEIRSRSQGVRAALFPAEEIAQVVQAGPLPPVATKAARRSPRERRRERSLRSSPRLVSRRPKGS